MGLVVDVKQETMEEKEVTVKSGMAVGRESGPCRYEASGHRHPHVATTHKGPMTHKGARTQMGISLFHPWLENRGMLQVGVLTPLEETDGNSLWMAFHSHVMHNYIAPNSHNTFFFAMMFAFI